MLGFFLEPKPFFAGNFNFEQFDQDYSIIKPFFQDY